VSRQSFGGIWVLDRDKGDQPRAESSSGSDNGGQRGRGGYSGRGGGGGRGRGGYGGYGGGSQDQREEDSARRQATTNYVRAATVSPSQLTIVVHDTSVSITDVDGQVQTLQTDNQKVEDRAENGLVKFVERNHWDNATLISEIDIDHGPKIVRTFDISPGGTELTMAIKVEGGQGKPMEFTHYYERPVESK